MYKVALPNYRSGPPQAHFAGRAQPWQYFYRHWCGGVFCLSGCLWNCGNYSKSKTGLIQPDYNKSWFWLFEYWTNPVFKCWLYIRNSKTEHSKSGIFWLLDKINSGIQVFILVPIYQKHFKTGQICVYKQMVGHLKTGPVFKWPIICLPDTNLSGNFWLLA